jgi:hypothetical protein
MPQKLLFPKRASQRYELQSVERFGDALLRTNDLDPVYVALWGAKLKPDQLKRLLLVYWCFYHLGVAAALSELKGNEFWRVLRIAAINEQSPYLVDLLWPIGRWPRSAERRYFRGAKCVATIDWLCVRERSPENLVDQLLEAGIGRSNILAAETIMQRIQEWPLFGPWIAFKAADMVERLFAMSVVFPENLTLIYKEPRSALDLLVGDPFKNMRRLAVHFGQQLAPPRYERPCGITECETVLCKWKSFVNGHYWVGKDISEIRTGLGSWGKTADLLLRHTPISLTQESRPV